MPIWQRENITKICFDNLKELQKDFNIEVLCIVSEQWAKIEAFKYGFKQVYASNDCLGTKMNIGVQEALQYDFEYLMNLGSDDIITKDLFKLYEPYFKNNKAIFGSRKLTFIDSKSKEAKLYDYDFLIGAGRCIRKDVLIECVVKDGNVDMYDKVNAGLDMCSLKRFYKYAHTEIDNDFNTIFDIKSDVNIWSYNCLKGKSISFENATKKLSTNQLDKILEL